jgi:transposase
VPKAPLRLKTWRWLMLYLGVDAHKNMSYVTAMTKEGQVRFRGALLNDKTEFEKLIKDLKEECVAVIETTYCWGVVYDLLESVGVKTKLAHAQKLRAIAESQIKNDMRDSEMLAHLLRANLIPEVYIPSKDLRLKKNILRERQYLAKKRTSIKNRIHNLLTRNHVKIEGCSDIFGKKGRNYMEMVEMPYSERGLLKMELSVLDEIEAKIKETEKLAKEMTGNDRYVELIKSVPGFGDVLSKVAAFEIADINRFSSSKKLASYAGLVPMEYASNNKIYRGPVVKQANKHLRWAFVEASWISLRSSLYFKSIYLNVKSRRGSNKAIVAVARHMVEIVHEMLLKNRCYEERLYKKSNNRPLCYPLSR